MPFSTKRVWCHDSVFVVWENVYEPAEDTFLFAENLDTAKGMVVLDMGTGSGVLGILAAKKADLVLAVDVNPNAIRCARENARLNNVQPKVLFVQSDLFSSIREGTEFDRILFNAPYLPTEMGESTIWLDRAWDGGATGRQEIDRFIIKASKYLKKNGRILLMQSSLIDVDDTISKFRTNNMRAKVVATHKLPFFETLLLLEAHRFN